MSFVETYKELELQIHTHHRISPHFDTVNHLLSPIMGLGGANKRAFAILTYISKSLFKCGWVWSSHLKNDSTTVRIDVTRVEEGYLLKLYLTYSN